MHMAMVIGGGIVLMGVFLLFGRLWGGDASGMATNASTSSSYDSSATDDQDKDQKETEHQH